MAYVFGHISGDVQTYLCPQYAADLTDPFILKKEIINHLFSIYKDPFKIQNAHFNYKA